MSSNSDPLVEFLRAHIVLPDGSTVGEWLGPQITEAYETGRMPNMLPGIPNAQIEGGRRD